MNVLHVTPHLGGGVGKAHAAIASALPNDMAQTFVLLEMPRDRRYADLIEARGARVIVAGSLDEVAALAGTADIVQFEFWNHPRLLECLARCAFPAMRSVLWSHISGLSRPVIPPGLIEAAGRFVFSTEASRAAPLMAMVDEAACAKTTAINSGFGFAHDRCVWQGVRAPSPRLRGEGWGEGVEFSRQDCTPSPGSLRSPASPRRRGEVGAAAGMKLARDSILRIAYLGTVDFLKMHPGFFDVVDRLDRHDIRVTVWGEADGAVIERARAMRHPERIVFGGQTSDPEAALGAADIFFYPLQRDHYGTAENALVEAMSLGLVPVVLDNPAEMAIVRDGETGFVAKSIEQCAALLQMLLASPSTLSRVSDNAIHDIAATRTPVRSAQDFATLWQTLLGEPKQRCDFRSAIGDSPAEWFLATQCWPGEAWSQPEHDRREAASKGALAHFEAAFPGDLSLRRLRASHRSSPRQREPRATISASAAGSGFPLSRE